MASAVDTIWRATFEAVAAHNLGVVLSVHPAGADKPLSFRTRLFEFSDRGMTVEFPAGPDARRTLRPDTFVSLLVVHGSNRWQCRSHIHKLGFYKLNASTKVHAARLGPPLDVESAQRREFYRVSLTGVEVEPVQMMRIVEQQADNDGPPGEHLRGGEPVPPTSFACQLINLSGGGMGVEAPQQAAPELLLDARYLCILTLPNDATPIEVTARLLHLRTNGDGSTYLGLEFEFDDRPSRQHCVDRVCRFTAWYQRTEQQRLREKT